MVAQVFKELTIIYTPYDEFVTVHPLAGLKA
jgi:hypothetical protein